jgi:MAM domain, meprin/A5/mu/Secretion system C-terminal sorting domain
MKNKFGQFRLMFFTVVIVLTVHVLPAQDGESKTNPKQQVGKMPSIQQMAEDIDKGLRYNVKKVLQANDSTTKFSNKYQNPELRLQYDFERLKDPSTGEIPVGIREKELAYIMSQESHLQEQVLIRGKQEGSTFIKTALGDPLTTFSNRGPFNVGGRTRALAIDINNENRLLAGSVSGGIWLSVNQGTSWQRVGPMDQNPSITSIVQDKRTGFQNIWYSSTGEAIGASQGGRSGSARFMGNGIYKSTDNGATWSLLPATVSNTPQNSSPSEPFELTAAMAIDPVNGNLYVATNRGIYRTQDGGTSFQAVLAVTNYGFFGQLDVHITSSRVFYAVIPRNVITSAGPGNAGIYRSTTGNAGEWTRITPAAFPATHGRTVVATAPSNENVLYVLSAGTSSAPVGHDFWKYTYVSGDGTAAGGVWQNRSANLPNFGGTAGNFNSQGGYDLYVKVHPTNENMTFVGGTNLYRSTDGFATSGNTAWIAGYNNALNNFSLYPNHHPDQHSMVFFPSNPNKVITGHDGGLSITQNITTNLATNPVTWTSLNNGYLTTQVYALAVGPGNLIMAGFQDNSTWATTSASANATWIDQFSGDGCATAINKTGTLRYVSAQLGVVYRVAYTDANDNTPNAFLNISPGSTGLFVTQFELDPNDDKLMYYIGENTIWRNSNATTATSTNGWTNLNNTPSTTQLSAIGISRNPSNVLYAGSVDGKIFRLDNAHVGNPVYVDIYSGKGLPPGNVSSLAVDPVNALRVIATFSNYNIKSIWLTEDGGISWTDISGNLEQNADGTGNGPSVRWMNIVGDNNVYLAATSTGLYSTKVLSGTTTTWSQVDPAILGVAVVEQVRSREDGLVVVGTHGNGLFSTTYEVNNVPVVVNQFPTNVSVLESAAPVIVPVGNVFRSTASVPLAITVTVESNTNPGLVSTAISGNNLTLTFAANASGTAIITLKGTDANAQFATTSFLVEVNPIIKTYPFVTNFPTGTLPFGYKVSGDFPWLVDSGGTPSAATGPNGDHTQADGSGFYIYTEASGPQPLAVGDFTLPVMDVSTLTFPTLSFFYHMHGAAMGSLEVLVRNVTTNSTTSMMILNGQQQPIQSDPYKEAVINLTSFVSAGRVQLIFRGVRGNDFTGDIAIDDIVVAQALANDVGIKSVSVRNPVGQNIPETVSIEITNYGVSSQSNFNVSYQVAGGSVITEVYTGTIASLETKPFTFATTFSRATLGVFQVVASTLLASDGKTQNNSGVANSTVIPTATLPYSESFETSNGGWTTGGTLSSWALGTPAGTFINTASHGTRAWVTNLTGNYPDNEQSYVMSPLYLISGISQIEANLDIKYRIEEGWDGAAFQASTDLGVTWTNIGALNDPVNWYNLNLDVETGSPALNFSGGNGDAWSGISAGAGYVTATHAITGLAGKSTLLLRMVFGSDNIITDEGIAFDNVIIGTRQTITFGALPTKIFSDPPFAISATGGSSGQPVTFSSSNTSVATISGATVTIVGAGTTTITANQAGSATHFAATPVPQLLTVNKSPQTITFAALPAKTFGDVAFALSATGGASGEPIIFSSSNTAVATVSGSMVTIIGAGSTNITASQAGNANFNAATPVVRVLTVNKANQTILFEPLTAKSVSDPPFNLTGTATSGLAVSYISSNTAVATVSGVTITLLSAGTTTITASQAGNANYNVASSVNQVLTVNTKLSQSITFGALAAKTFGEAPFALSATASSSLPVSYTSSNSSVATISGSTVTIQGAGSTTITASQAGNATFNPANPVQQELVVNKASQSITFNALETKQLSTGTFNLSATSSSGLPVSYSSSNTSVATISGTVVTLVSAGNTTITASQTGNGNYNAATPVNQALTVSAMLSQAISFAALPDKIFGGASFELTATATSGLPVSYSSSVATVATVSGNTVTIVGVGATIITASQAGNAVYHPAGIVLQILTVTKANQTITFNPLVAKTIGDVAFELTATASSGLVVSYFSASDKIGIIGSNVVTLVKAGRATIAAAQSGNTNFNAATSVDQSFCIKPAKPSITLSNANTETPLLTSSSAAGNQWYLNGIEIANAVNATFTATQSGVYKVQVKVDDCVSEFSLDQSVVITGDIETDTPVEIYPNPVSGWLTVSLGGLQGRKEVTIYELNGRKTESQEVSGNEARFNTAHYAAGVYLVKVKTENFVKILRLVKK